MSGKSLTSFWVTASVMAAALLMSVLVALPPTAISGDLSASFRLGYSAVISQGWNFFTRDMQSINYGVYSTSTTDEFGSMLTTPQTRVENLWGLSRTQRAQGPEIAILAAEVDAWKECESLRIACVSEAEGTQGQRMVNGSLLPTLCGRVILTQERTSPWSYRAFAGANSPVVEQYAFIDAECNGGER
jgi:antimicrobial peptide system SdpA family protein